MFLLRAISRLLRPAAPQGLVGHLEALRRTIIGMLLITAASFALCFCCAPQLMELLRRPAEQVWAEHEAAHLPPDISPDDWGTAKELAALRPALSPVVAATLHRRLSPAVRELADAVPLLRAARLLPADAQKEAIMLLPATPKRALALRLHDTGAELREGWQRGQLRLMGAFRPAEGFFIAVNISFVAGLIIAFPVLLFLLLRFIMPGLHPQERALLRRALLAGTLLFLGGCAFAYAVVLPRVLHFFFTYAQELGVENDWRIGYYLSFAAKLVLVFGAVFELPVLLYPLIRLHLLTYELMRRTRGYAFLICLGLALLLAPAPDPGTMLLLALPLYALYELCILFARYEQKNNTPS